MNFLGVDLGGTNIKAGLWSGRTLASDSIPTLADRGPADTLRRVIEFGKKLAGRRKIDACGMGVPGPLDLERRVLFQAVNMKGWTHVRVPEILRRGLGVPSFMENDANCAALGEYHAWPPVPGFVLYTLGTGVGGGIVLDGRLWVGASGAAGELGHMVIDPHGPVCGCGKRGCVEAYASATNVAKNAGMPAHEAFPAAKRGNARAKKSIDLACWALAVGISNMINVLHPDLIVLAGGMAAAGRALLDPVRAEVRKRVFPVHLQKIRIEGTRLGDEAGWIGAALWARHKLS